MSHTSIQDTEESKDEQSRRAPRAAQSTTCFLSSYQLTNPPPIPSPSLGLIPRGEGRAQTRINEAYKADKAHKSKPSCSGFCGISAGISGNACLQLAASIWLGQKTGRRCSSILWTVQRHRKLLPWNLSCFSSIYRTDLDCVQVSIWEVPPQIMILESKSKQPKI